VEQLLKGFRTFVKAMQHSAAGGNSGNENLWISVALVSEKECLAKMQKQREGTHGTPLILRLI
jgi:hypothetical protein